MPAATLSVPHGLLLFSELDFSFLENVTLLGYFRSVIFAHVAVSGEIDAATCTGSDQRRTWLFPRCLKP